MKRTVIAVFVLFITLAVGVRSFALNTSIITESVDETRKERFLSSYTITVSHDEPEKRPIKSFAVSEMGMVAVCFIPEGKETIAIYSNAGEFQYAYHITKYGSMALEWDGENLNIYFRHSNLMLSLTPTGEICAVQGFAHSTENQGILNDMAQTRQYTVNDVQYTLEKNMGILNLFSFYYSQVKVVNEGGSETVVYDATESNQKSAFQTLTTIGFALCIIISASVPAIISRRARRKNVVTADPQYSQNMTTPRSKENLMTKRSLAFVVDSLWIITVAGIVMFVIGLIFPDIDEVVSTVINNLLRIGLLLFRDVIGIGKRLMKLRVVDQKGRRASFSKLIIRNVTLVIPLVDMIIAFFTVRLGDRLANTTVVMDSAPVIHR